MIQRKLSEKNPKNTLPINIHDTIAGWPKRIRRKVKVCLIVVLSSYYSCGIKLRSEEMPILDLINIANDESSWENLKPLTGNPQQPSSTSK